MLQGEREPSGPRERWDPGFNPRLCLPGLPRPRPVDTPTPKKPALSHTLGFLSVVSWLRGRDRVAYTSIFWTGRHIFRRMKSNYMSLIFPRKRKKETPFYPTYPSAKQDSDNLTNTQKPLWPATQHGVVKGPSGRGKPHSTWVKVI